MTLGNGTWQKLNAYVDDELSARERAVVAEDIAADPELARGVAVLQALKAELSEFPDSAAPTRGRAGGGPMAFSSLCWMSAACMAFLLIGAALFSDLVWRSTPDPLMARHTAWAEANPSLAPQSEAGLVSAFFGPQLPALTPFGLTLSTVALVSLEGGGEVLHAGYVGRRGCRVSLFLQQTKGEAARLLHKPDDFLYIQGDAGGWSYQLLAQDMDAGRFVLIAEALDEQLRLLAPLPDDSRLAYQANPAARAPCLT